MAASRLGSVLILGLLTACSARAVDGADSIPEEEVDAREFCPEFDHGPVAELATDVSGVIAGPCGHLIYEVANAQAHLYTPGEAPEPIDAEEWFARFAPTGHLVAWAHKDNEGVALRDLLSGEQTELPRAERFGFVPAPDTEHGADLWTCADRRLELAGPVNTAVIAEDVRCASVAGSSGSPRVVFAGADDRVRFADLERLEVWDTDDTEHLVGPSDGLGWRDDTLWIDHDGVVLVHVRQRWEMDSDVDSDHLVVLGTRVFVGTEELASWDADPPIGVQQAPRRGAPVVLRQRGDVIAIVDGERHDHPAGFGDSSLDGRGRLILHDSEQMTLKRLTLDGERLETLASDVDAMELGVAPEGEWIALDLDEGDCLEDPTGACDLRLGSLGSWREGEGLREHRRAGLRWELLAVDDAGQLLTLGIPLEPGPTPDPLPPEELILLDADLEILATYPAPDGFTREILTLEDGRFVVELHASGVGGSGQLLIVGPDAITAIPEAAGVEHGEVWADARGRQVAFVARSGDGSGPRTLFVGGGV